MNLKLRLLFISTSLSVLSFSNPLKAQQAETVFEKSTLEFQRIPVPRIQSSPLPVLFGLPNSDTTVAEEEIRPELSEDDKTIISQIADIYRLYVLSLESQLNNDALSTEKYISSSISDMQKMLEDNPEIQQSKRFTELYRTVITEYREFYGVTDSSLDENGEIFAIQDELFKEEDSDYLASNLTWPSISNVKKTVVPLPQNRYVNNQLAYLWMKKPEIMEAWLQRKETYFPMMEKIFEEENVPKELMYLAMIESGLNPKARSKAAAVGMWQFIRATGAMYGLEVNWWVDERLDPVKATRAAARHLRDLYAYWKDWHLALANYNVSPARLKRAINSSNGVKDYWVIYPYLPRETRGYVPSFIATTMIASNPVQFGFKEAYEGEPFKYETVEVKGSYDLTFLAECAGINVNTLKEYNTALLRWATPPGDVVYPLRLPVGTKEAFLAKFKNAPASKQMQLFVHKVKSGESLGKIASKYGITVRDLYASNDKLGKVIYPGQELVVPIPDGNVSKILADRPSNEPSAINRVTYASTNAMQPPNTSALIYTVKSGDTIGDIAEWYRVRASDIRAWNRVGNLIRVGQKLTVYVPTSKRSQFAGINGMSKTQKKQLNAKSTNLVTASYDGFVTYQVKKNDNLSDIANSFGISVQNLKKLNNLRGNTIHPGQTLKIKQQ